MIYIQVLIFHSFVIFIALLLKTAEVIDENQVKYSL